MLAATREFLQRRREDMDWSISRAKDAIGRARETIVQCEAELIRLAEEQADIDRLLQGDEDGADRSAYNRQGQPGTPQPSAAPDALPGNVPSDASA